MKKNATTKKRSLSLAPRTKWPEDSGNADRRKRQKKTHLGAEGYAVIEYIRDPSGKEEPVAYCASEKIASTAGTHAYTPFGIRNYDHYRCTFTKDKWQCQAFGWLIRVPNPEKAEPRQLHGLLYNNFCPKHCVDKRVPFLWDLWQKCKEIMAPSPQDVICVDDEE